MGSVEQEPFLLLHPTIETVPVLKCFIVKTPDEGQYLK
jgi:hypothetical protein